MEELAVKVSDLQKVLDALVSTHKFLKLRDEMNAEVHLAREVRYSPLTTTVAAQCDRVRMILSDGGFA